MTWWGKKKTKGADYDYTFFTLSPEGFKKIKDEIIDIGYYQHLDTIHNIIVLWIPVKKSEDVQNIAKSKEATINPSGMKASLEKQFRKQAYGALYKRVLKSDVEPSLNKIIYDKGAAIRDKTEIDREINEMLEKIDEVSEQFNSPGKFMEIAEDEDMSMTLKTICAKMREFKGTKY